MKWFDKIIFFLNSFAAILLALSYILPYSPPKVFGVLSVLSLIVPILLIINIIFFVYWCIRLKRQALVSLLVILFGISHIRSLYKLNGSVENTEKKAPLTLMSYNVRQFDRFNWLGEEGSVAEEITSFINKKDPQILCFQEYYYSPKVDFSHYPYKYIDFNNNSNEIGQAIYSKVPILNRGTLRFEHTANNVVFADLKFEKDTIRLYNVHLQSHKISPVPEELQKEESKKLLRRISNSFIEQQKQIEQVIAHMQTSPYRCIIAGDFNNTANSYIYKEFIDRGFVDSFEEEGQGFGKTYNFPFFPLRIDYILLDKSMKTLYFENYDFPLSDHFPIYAGFSL